MKLLKAELGIGGLLLAYGAVRILSYHVGSLRIVQSQEQAQQASLPRPSLIDSAKAVLTTPSTLVAFWQMPAELVGNVNVNGLAGLRGLGCNCNKVPAVNMLAAGRVLQ